MIYQLFSVPPFTGSRVLRFANHGTREGFVGLANDFTVLQDDWVQVAPYGDYPHPGPVNKNGKPVFPRGVIQRLDNASGEAMVSQYNSLSGRLGRLFGGLPWYVGHHDLDPIKYPDGAAYGWIMKLENRADGVYAQVKWTEDGEALKNKGSYKFFSPYWDGIDTKKTDATGRAIVMPNVLISVAFTNQPNIPVMPLANEEAPTLKDLTKASLANSYIDDAVEEGTLSENDRSEWLGYFKIDYKTARQTLANAGTSEGARKGWETRRAGMSAKADKAPKAAAKAAAKTKRAGKKAVPAPPPTAALPASGTSRGQMRRQALIAKAGGKAPAAAVAAARKTSGASIKATPMTKDEARGKVTDLAKELDKGEKGDLNGKLSAMSAEDRKGVVKSLGLKTDKNLPFRAASPLQEKHGAAISQAANRLYQHAFL